MKKLVFLLLSLLMVCGALCAAVIHDQPGAAAPEAVLSGYGADSGIVTPGTVPALALFERAGFLAGSAYDGFAGQP